MWDPCRSSCCKDRAQKEKNKPQGVIFMGFFHLKIPLQLKAGEGIDCRDGGNYHRRHRSGVIAEQKGLSDRWEPK